MRYAISDIHGCNTTFRHALDEIDLSKDDQLFLLGDYIDRGPDSMGVLETIWQLIDEGHQVTCLRGNHEQMLLDYQRGERLRFDWVPPAGKAAAVTAWMDSLPYHHLTPGYVLVHAGLNFKEHNPLDDRDAMLWIRYWYGDLDRGWLGERIIVHGHTPAPLEEIKLGVKFMASTQRVCIDSGCAWNKPGMSNLTVLNLDTQEARYFARQT